MGSSVRAHEALWSAPMPMWWSPAWSQSDAAGGVVGDVADAPVASGVVVGAGCGAGGVGLGEGAAVERSVGVMVAVT